MSFVSKAVGTPADRTTNWSAVPIPASDALRRAPGPSASILTSQHAFVHVGSPSAVAAALFAFARNGASYFAFSITWPMRAIARPASVPGLIGSHFHAFDTAFDIRGSTTANLSRPEARPSAIRRLRFVGP